MTDANSQPTPQMEEVVCVASHPVDLNDGRTIEPNTSAQADVNDPHNQALFDNGDLIRTPTQAAPNVAQPTPEDEPAPPPADTIGVFEGRPGGEEG